MVRSTGAMTSSPTRASAAASRTGAGQYAPMPPVLGPRSPSSRRLWSCAGGSSTERASAQRLLVLLRREQHVPCAVSQRDDADLRAVQHLLEDQRPARLAEGRERA